MVTLWMDASSLCWGAHFAGDEMSGNFLEHLQHAHISVKELYAVHAGLQMFLTHVAEAHVKLMCDNLLFQ